MTTISAVLTPSASDHGVDGYAVFPPARGARVGRFTVAHALPRRIRLKSSLLGAPDFDATYYRALLEALPGVEEAAINPRAVSLTIVFDGRAETWAALEPYLADIPMEAWLPYGGGEGRIDLSDVISKGVLTAATLAMPTSMNTARAVTSLAVGGGTLVKGVETLMTRGVKVQVLDALAVGLSLARGNYFTAGAIPTLLTLGEYLEEKSEQRSAELLKSLLRPQAEEVWVVRNGVEHRVSIKDVQTGDHVIFGAGEAVAVDGVIAEGEASVNQSSISGESVPVHLQPGDPVISGSVVDEGRLVVLVEKAGSETSVARIGRFIDQTLRNKSKKQSKSSELADKLVPVTLGIGALNWLFTRDINKVASVLTVDFSCAIKLTNPIAMRSGIYAAGKAGVLLKGSSALDDLQDVDTMVFDKTGTLTTGRLQVTDVVALDGLSEDEVLAMAAGAEEHYDHPVARAVLKEAKARGLPMPPVSRVDFIVAHGVSAYIDDQNVLVGSHHFLAEDEGVPCSHTDEAARALRGQGKSLLFVAREGKLAGVIALLDQPRPEAADVLEALKRDGVKRIVVLTGDHRDTAMALRRALPQIDDIRHDLKPEDKASVVEDLKKEGAFLAFVGDGVNDAPALVNAQVGICMPGGADLAKEAAQVLLLKEDLRTLLHARQASNRTGRIIRQCFAATIGCNSVTILMAMAGLPPVASALLHNLSTVGILGYAGMAASEPLESV